MIDFNSIPSPCFLMDERLLIKNLELMKKVKDESGCTLILALKGFSMSSVFPLIGKYLDGAASSSLNESRLCFEEMKTKSHIYAPIYKEEEFSEMKKYAKHFTFNSLSQWEKYKDKVDSISCGIRINPEYSEVKTDMYNPCRIGSRLGVTIDKFEGGNLPKGLDGIHFHSLCENDSFTLERTLKEIEKKFPKMLEQSKWINMGGGHLMTKEGYDTDHLIHLIKEFIKRWDIEVILEPGSAVAWKTGYLVSTVEDIFDSSGNMVAMLDVSFSAHMPDTLEMPYKPNILGAHIDKKDNKYRYCLGGGTCLSGDFIEDYYFDKPLKTGDRIIFEDMMHYTMVKTTTFNGVKLPSIAILKQTNDLQVVRSYGYDTFKDRIG